MWLHSVVEVQPDCNFLVGDHTRRTPRINSVTGRRILPEINPPCGLENRGRQVQTCFTLKLFRVASPTPHRFFRPVRQPSEHPLIAVWREEAAAIRATMARNGEVTAEMIRRQYRSPSVSTMPPPRALSAPAPFWRRRHAPAGAGSSILQ